LFSFASQAQEGDPFYSNTNPYFKTGNVGECTWYVWGRVYANDRIPLPHWGDAGAWFGSASTSGYQTGSTPKPHSVAVWVGGKGHVAYIERIEGGLVYFSQANFNGQAENDGISSRTPEGMKKLLIGGELHYIYLGNSQSSSGRTDIPAPVLDSISPPINTVGTFTVDLIGDSFQPDALVFAQKFVQGEKKPELV